jgi:Zn-finger nucleic acid-binding protein
MKCPQCRSELKSETRQRIDVQRRPSCQGMWFDPQEFKALEDEVFDLDEHA